MSLREREGRRVEWRWLEREEYSQTVCTVERGENSEAGGMRGR